MNKPVLFLLCQVILFFATVFEAAETNFLSYDFNQQNGSSTLIDLETLSSELSEEHRALIRATFNIPPQQKIYLNGDSSSSASDIFESDFNSETSVLNLEEALYLQDQLDQDFFEQEIEIFSQPENKILRFTGNIFEDETQYEIFNNSSNNDFNFAEDLFDRPIPGQIDNNNNFNFEIKTDNPTENSTSHLNVLRSNLHAEIMTRLNAPEIKEFHNVTLYYKVNNWPYFVSLYSEDWDELDVKNIRLALPDLSFTKLTRHMKKVFRQRFIGYENIEINRILLDKFSSQNSTPSANIPWLKYHLKGWPVGVSDHSRCRSFNRREMRAISRGIEKISFVPVLDNEKRTVTYTNGEVLTAAIETPKLKRRKLRHILNDNNDSD